MKKILIFLSCLILYQTAFTQISGSTKPGRLIPKKEEPKKEIVTPPKEKEEVILAPQITILDPVIPKSREVKHKESSITVRGKVFDAKGVKEIIVNGYEATILKDNLFFANVLLNSGTNIVIVKATNLRDISSEVTFRVTTDIDQAGPKITIIEPQVQRGIKIIRKTELVNIKGVMLINNLIDSKNANTFNISEQDLIKKLKEFDVNYETIWKDILQFHYHKADLNEYESSGIYAAIKFGSRVNIPYIAAHRFLNQKELEKDPKYLESKMKAARLAKYEK